MRKHQSGGARAASTMLAAGGLVVRDVPPGILEIALIHRPGIDDWSFPKGKLEAGESLEQCALREVAEETGLLCRVTTFVGTTDYLDRRGRPKTVSYWLMHPTEGTFRPSQEVDAMRWLPVEDALALLSYDLDRDLLEHTDLSGLLALH